MMPLVGFFLLALGISLVLTPACRTAAIRLGYVAKPKEDRWHKRPTALFGGVAIGATTLLIALLVHPDQQVWRLFAAGSLLWLCGFLDDLLSLKPSTKLIAQVSVASLLLFFGYRLQWTHSMIADAMLTLVWIVGVTNAFNLLDNMDGLCGGIVLIAGAFLLIGMVGATGATPTALYLAGLLGATAGFLVYNIHPATIFMGDTGSLFLGVNVAALTLMIQSDGRSKSSLMSVVAAPVLLMLIPIVDTTLVTAMRLLSGRRPSQGGRDHTSHRLVAVGLSEPAAVAVLWTLAGAAGTISLLLRTYAQGWAAVLAPAFVLAMIIFGVYLARVRVYEEADLAALKGQTFTPLVVDFLYKRRVAEVLLDVCLVPLAYYTAYRLRFEGDQFAAFYPSFLKSLPVVLTAQLLALFVVGGYRGTWRYFGMMDAVVFAKAVLLGTAGAELFILYVYRFENYSRSVFVIYAVLIGLLLAATRASFRLVGEFIQRRTSTGIRCLIYGTGGAALSTIRDAFGTAQPIKVIGYVEDDPGLRSVRVAGYPVVGDFSTLLDVIARGDVECVVLNVRAIDAARMQELEAACREAAVDLLRLDVGLRRLSTAS